MSAEIVKLLVGGLAIPLAWKSLFRVSLELFAPPTEAELLEYQVDPAVKEVVLMNETTATMVPELLAFAQNFEREAQWEQLVKAAEEILMNAPEEVLEHGDTSQSKTKLK